MLIMPVIPYLLLTLLTPPHPFKELEYLNIILKRVQHPATICVWLAYFY